MMTGRKPKPLTFHVVNGNKSHLTKSEMKEREGAEIKIGHRRFVCPLVVKGDKVAFAKWKKLQKHFKSDECKELITDVDIGFIARYCRAHSEYINLLERRASINDYEGMSFNEVMAATSEMEEFKTQKAINALFKKVDFIYSTYGLMAIEGSINKKMDQLMRMEDRLFLNPLSRIRTSTAKKKGAEKDPLSEAGFGEI